MCAWMHIIAIKSAWLDEAKSLCNFFTILCNIIWFKRSLISWSLVLQLFPKCRQFFRWSMPKLQGPVILWDTLWQSAQSGDTGDAQAEMDQVEPKFKSQDNRFWKNWLAITSVELSCAFLWFFWDFIRISNTKNMELHCIDFSTMLHIYLVKSSPYNLS